MKRYINIVFSILCFFLYVFLNPPDKNNYSFKSDDYIHTYYTDFAGSYRHSGVYFHRTDNTEYFYFGEVLTHKVIKIMDDKGKLKWTIPLNTITNKGERIENFNIVDLDTIVVVSNKTNRIYCLNRKGECWKEIVLDSIIKTREIYEYGLPWIGNFVHGHEVYLDPCWYGNKDIRESKNAFLNVVQHYKKITDLLTF